MKLVFLAGRTADKLNAFETGLSAETKTTCPPKSKELFPKNLSKKMKRGSVLDPSDQHMENIKTLDKEFENHHPKNGIKRGCGVRNTLIRILIFKFPHISTKLITEFVISRTEYRLRSMNIALKRKKRSTIRNTRKKAEYVC